MYRRQAGATLIELIVAIVIITAAAGTIVALLAAMSRNSAETMVQSQSASIASAYLNEILSKPFANPAATADRALADSIFDYPGCLPDSVVRDHLKNPIANFQNFQVSVVVAVPPLALQLPGIPAADQAMVEIWVTSPFNERTVLRGYKTNHT